MLKRRITNLRGVDDRIAALNSIELFVLNDTGKRVQGSSLCVTIRKAYSRFVSTV